MVLPGNAGGIGLQGSSVMYMPAAAQVVAPTPLSMPVTSVPIPGSLASSITLCHSADTIVKAGSSGADNSSLATDKLDLIDTKDDVPQIKHSPLKPAQVSVTESSGTETESIHYTVTHESSTCDTTVLKNI